MDNAFSIQEFTLAEIEYQVEELLFRMNALTGTHSLPEKPPCYLTDSDCTYGGGDDGISSGGSEVKFRLFTLLRDLTIPHLDL